MAIQKTIRYKDFQVLLGDGATPTEAFTRPCALRSRGLNITSGTSEINLLDCTDEQAASWLARNVVSKSATITGAGAVDPEDWDEWRDYALSGDSRNVRVLVDLPLANNGGHFQGAFIMTSFNLTASKEEAGGVVQFEVELQTDGELVWTPAAA